MISLPAALVSILFFSYPFSETLVSKTFSLTPLSRQQKSNIRVALKALDGTVLQPQEEFSFNRVVGPRTEGRGYRPAPSYIGPNSPATVGGGICLVSSALYQASLEAGLTPTERSPHTRTISSVPAGLDATVWYGGKDLRFKNTLPYPIKIVSQWSPQMLRLKFLGKPETTFVPCRIETVTVEKTQDHLLVETLRYRRSKVEFLSRDSYKISR